MNVGTTIVAGAGGRIGRALTLSLTAQGNNVAVVDPSPEIHHLFEKEVKSRRLLVFREDATDPQKLDRVIGECELAFGPVTAAVNCSYPRTTNYGADFLEATAKDVRSHVGEHIGGTIVFAQRVMKHFLENKFGRLAFLSSIQGIYPPKFYHYEQTDMTCPIEYAASKAAIIHITKYLAKKYAQKGVTVNCVSPGGVLDNQIDTFVQRYRDSCNSKGLLNELDIVPHIEMLLSEKGRFITGQNIIIDDGWSL